MAAEEKKPTEPPKKIPGIPRVPPPEVFERARRNNPLWFQVMDKALHQFEERPENAGILPRPDGTGATLEQVAMVIVTLQGFEDYCLLARPVPEEQIGRLKRVIRSTPEEVVGALKEIHRKAGAVGGEFLTFDGRTGHALVLLEYDAKRDRFIYHDPWPERSLLCQENNLAGVDAQPEGKQWSVTSDELESVVYAAFIAPWQWAVLQGVEPVLRYEAWKESEFFRFFHLHEIESGMEGDLTHRIFAPGPFGQDIALEVYANPQGKIVGAGLLMKERWMADNLLMALDLTKSFVSAFAPVPDQAAYAEISDTLWQLRDPQFALEMKDKDSRDQTVACVHAFMGAKKEASLNTDFGLLSFENVVQGGERMQQITFGLR